MKKILLATTVLVGTAGFAAAEITLSGSAVMGVGNDGTDTFSQMETYVTFTGAGETDGGLSFGLESTIATYSTAGGLNDDGTSVFISGAFGKLAMGSVSEADEVATLSDIGGIGGLGVDDVAEAFSGDSNKTLIRAAGPYGAAAKDAYKAGHDINYSYSAGDISVAASTRLADGTGNTGYAVGAKYTFGDAYVGAGYNHADLDAVAGAIDVNPAAPVLNGPDNIDLVDSVETTTVSLYAGGKFGDVSVKAMYTNFDGTAVEDGEDYTAEGNAYGVHVSYSMDALTLSAAYSQLEIGADGLPGEVSQDAYGIGAAYDLGGDASVTGGIAHVNEETVWEAGVSMSF